MITYNPIYHYQINNGGKTEFYSCKNCELIIGEESSLDKNDPKNQEIIKAVDYFDKLMTSEEDRKLRDEANKHKPKTIIVYGIEIIAYPAEFHLIGYETHQQGTWCREDGYFSNSGQYTSSYFCSRCNGCKFYEDNQCKYKLFPIDPEIENICPKFKYKEISMNANTILTDIIKKGEQYD